MTLHVHELSKTDPIDTSYLHAVARTHLAAWLTVPLMKAIYYGPPSAYPGYLKGMHERHAKAFHEEKDCFFAVVIDDELPIDDEVQQALSAHGDQGRSPPRGRVIAAVRYNIVTPTSSDPSTTNPPSSTAKREWPPYSNQALASDFWSHLVQGRSFLTERLGEHLLVDNLYTSPTHHRRGAGSMLMRHCCDKADRRGLPSMLEASPKGLGVYESVGFRRVGEGGMDGKGNIWVDLDRWIDGGDKGEKNTVERVEREGWGVGQKWYAQILMVRPSKGAS
jgi:GNAT superfamily N-acetyltransferase